MGTLVLVRHGQASFGASDYDVLSPLGERQGVLLGEHWQRCGLAPGACWSGTMQRQRVTAERALGVLGDAPARLEIDAAFDEYDHRGLIRAYRPRIAREHPEFDLDPRALLADRRVFQNYFNHVVEAWMAGLDAEGPIAESWAAFSARCLAGLSRIAARDEHAVVFTSGGVITTALQRALGVDDGMALRLNWRIFNASVHVFRSGRSGLQLVGYNDVAHLQLHRDPSLLTHR